MKVLILTAVWQRPELTEICFHGLKRLQSKNVRVFIIYSEEWVKPLLKKFGFSGKMTPNEPLGRKFNEGLKSAMRFNWDYLIQIGSDDFIDSRILDVYQPYMKEGREFFGINKINVINLKDYRVAYFENTYVIGGARCIKRSILKGLGNKVLFRFDKPLPGHSEGKRVILIERIGEKLEKAGVGEIEKRHPVPFSLWSDNRERALDGDSNDKLMANGFNPEVVEFSEPLIVGIKAGTNLNDFDSFIENGYKITNNGERILKQFPEYDKLRKFRQKNYHTVRY